MKWIYHLFFSSEYDSFTSESEMFWIGFMFLALGLLLLGITIWFIYSSIYDYLDSKRSTIELKSGTLIDKRYKGESSSSSTGTAVIPNTSGGIGVGVISTTSTEPEQFLLFIQSDQIYKIKVSMEHFYKWNIGDKINFSLKVGGLSKGILKSTVQ